MYQDPESLVITRHFVNFPDRQVHFRLAGSGPPVLLLHQSPTSSAEMASEIETFANDFTVICPDTPGFGLSDSLPAASVDGKPDLTPYARALEAFLTALGIDRILIYGFHTGAMIGFEFARLFPDRVAAAVVNGLVVFEGDELADLLENYNTLPRVTSEGEHLAWLWARMRDQRLFFPWYRKEPAARMGFDLPDASQINPNLIDFLRSAEGGRAAYQAAFAFPTRERMPETSAPVYLLNYRHDPLAGHPERLSSWPACVRREIFTDPSALQDRVGEILIEHAPVAHELARESSGVFAGLMRNEIVNTEVGPVFVRYSKPDSRSAILLLHDAGSSSRSLESVARELAEAGLGDGAARRQVVLVDLPGHGETGALHLENFSADALAQLLWGVIGRLDIDDLDIVALGASCFVATAMRSSCVTDPVRPAALNNVVLIDPWLFEDAERQTMLERYTPDLSPGDFGQHLLEAWYFARDGELFWPWNSPLVNNALNRAPEILPAQIQARATDVIKAGPEFHRLVRDLLAYDFAGMLEAAGSSNGPIWVCARQGNGHEKRARRAAEIAAATYTELPARLADWPPVLATVLSDNAGTLD